LDPDHLKLAKSRQLDLLSRRVVATARIFEHEISDAGGQNPEPRILGIARKILVRDGKLKQTLGKDDPAWFYLPDAPPDTVESRRATLADLHRELSRPAVTRHCGQCLEIAIYRALCAQPDARYLGRFRDFDPTDPTRTRNLYRKEEPPYYIGNREIPGKGRLDFIYLHPFAGPAGVEAKNGREWLYPDGDEIKELLFKCVALDSVPVLIARRFPSVTIEILGMSGVVLHQTRNQLYHVADRELADRAKRKDSLGFDDIRVGDEPDDDLLRFIGTTLPEVLPEARTRFDEFKDLLARYTGREIQFPEFAGRARRRAAGKVEADWEDDQDHPDDNYY